MPTGDDAEEVEDVDGADPFHELRLDEAFVRSARTREPSYAERRIISLDEERRRRRGPSSPSDGGAPASALPFLPMPTPRAVAVIASVVAAALLLGGLPPFLR